MSDQFDPFAEPLEAGDSPAQMDMSESSEDAEVARVLAEAINRKRSRASLQTSSTTQKSSENSESESDSVVREVLNRAKRARVDEGSLSDDGDAKSEDFEDEEDEDEENDESVDLEVLPTGIRSTKSGRTVKPVDRMEPEMSESESEEEEEDGEKKKKTSKKKRTKKRVVYEQENHTHGFCEADNSFVLYARMTGIERNEHGQPEAVLASAVFEIAEYADDVMRKIAGTEGERRTSDPCMAPSYTKEIIADTERLMDLRAKVEKGVCDPTRVFRGALICRLRGSDAFPIDKLSQIVSPFSIFPLRVKIHANLIGYEKLATCSIAPFFKFDSRMRASMRFGIPMGSHEVRRFTTSDQRFSSKKIPNFLCGQPIGPNVAAEFTVLDREPVYYTCPNPVVEELNAHRPMFIAAPPKSRKTNCSWSPTSLYANPGSVTISPINQTDNLMCASTVSEVLPEFDGKLSSEIRNASKMTGQSYSWIGRKDVRRLFAGALVPRSIKGHRVAKKSQLSQEAMIETFVHWVDASGNVALVPNKIRAICPDQREFATAFLCPFLSENVYVIERHLNMELALVLLCRRKHLAAAKYVKAGKIWTLLANRTLVREAWGALKEIADQRLIRLAALDGLVGPEPELPKNQRMTNLWRHSERVRIAADPSRSEEVSLAESRLRNLLEIVEMLISHESCALEGDKAAMLDLDFLRENYMFPAVESPLTCFPGSNRVGWSETAIPARAFSNLLLAQNRPRTPMLVRSGVKEDLDRVFFETLSDQLKEPGTELVWLICKGATEEEETRKLIKQHSFPPKVRLTTVKMAKLVNMKTSSAVGALLRKRGRKVKLALPRADLMTPEELTTVLAVCLESKTGEQFHKNAAELGNKAFRSDIWYKHISARKHVSGLDTGICALPPLIGGMAYGDNVLFESAAVLGDQERVLNVSANVVFEGKKALKVTFVSEEGPARKLMSRALASPTSHMLFLPSEGRLRMQNENIKRGIKSNILPSRSLGSKKEFENIPEDCKTLIVAPADKSNPLWERGFGQLPPDAEYARKAKILTGIQSVPKDKKVFVLGSYSYLFEWLEGKSLWQIADYAKVPLGIE